MLDFKIFITEGIIVVNLKYRGISFNYTLFS